MINQLGIQYRRISVKPFERYIILRHVYLFFFQNQNIASRMAST